MAKPKRKNLSTQHSGRGTNKGGRPDKYGQVMLGVAKTLAGLGASDSKMAGELKISVRTLYLWRMEHPEFAKSIDEGRWDFDNGRIERSLRAQAVPHDEITVFEELRGRGANKKLVPVARTVRKNQVNTAAAAKVLAAERPEKYGDKLEHTGNVMCNVVMFGKEEKADGAGAGR